MKKHLTHQIDESAQQVFLSALPKSWVANEQFRDYGKDYVVEIGDDDGELTGSSFYVQLKGQTSAQFDKAQRQFSFALETKYAEYFLDKIKDLPVFLVVADTTARRAWWLFIQPVLAVSSDWRSQKTRTVHLPIENDLSDVARFRIAIEDAKKWMKLNDPTAIADAIAAKKELVARLDPRFEARISVVDDMTSIRLEPTVDVPIEMRFRGREKGFRKKVSSLLNQGQLVSFEPGEVKITGSPLFESIERTGGKMQMAVDLRVALSLTGRGADGTSLGGLSDMPGRLTGGRTEFWFEGHYERSPFQVRFGPVNETLSGSATFEFKWNRWDGQSVLQLAHFDRLQSFFHQLQNSTSIAVQCQQDGNPLFDCSIDLPRAEAVAQAAGNFDVLQKARRIAERFKINPKWSTAEFDIDARKTVEELYAVFFESGSSRPMPNCRLSLECEPNSFRHDVAKALTDKSAVRIASEYEYAFLGHQVQVGRLFHEFTDMKINVLRGKSSTRVSKWIGRKRSKSKLRATTSKSIGVELLGSKTTVMTVRVATAEDP